jgi:glycosyltransferase involved in cell wall biosynthesis
MLKFYIDSYSNTEIIGWAADTRSNSFVIVDVIVNGDVIDSIKSNQFRQDLLEGGIGDGNHGFIIDIMKFQLPYGEHTLHLVDQYSKKLIGNNEGIVIKSTNGIKNFTSLSKSLMPNHISTSKWLSYKKDAVKYLNIYTITFFDFEGREVYPGGAERYIFDLAVIASKFGLKTRVFQVGNSYWERSVKNISVYAMPHPGSISEISRRFCELTDAAQINVYSPFTLAMSSVNRPAIGICHGVYWDVDGNEINRGENSVAVLSGILHADTTVSVDANSINFLRAFHSELSRKVKYIPNYTGDEFFHTNKKIEKNRKNLTVIYPRRLYSARGYWLVAEIMVDVFEKYPFVKFLFIGGADDAERESVVHYATKYPKNVEWHISLPDDMPKWYAISDIAVIPTVHSEGTSLSALEALAAGLTVVSTDVGGLSNIIIDELNGLLISPSADELKNALFRLIDNIDLRQYLSQNGIKTAQAFSKRKWALQWQSIFSNCCDVDESNLSEEASVETEHTKIVHLRADGISWGGDKDKTLPVQRPHHVMKAIALSGFSTVIFTDETQQCPRNPSNTTKHIILGKGAKLYEKNVVYYIYYAHLVWVIKDRVPKEKWKLFSEEYQKKLDAITENHDVSSYLVWFDLIDSPTIHNNDDYTHAVKLLMEYADMVSVSSKILYDEIRTQRKDLVLLENACWLSDFNMLPKDKTFLYNEKIAYLKSNKRTGVHVVGYMGAIASWFDFELFSFLLAKQDAIYVVAGPIAKEVKDIFHNLEIKYSNLIYLGIVGYNSLPQLIDIFDVGVIPFLINDITNVTNPVKLYEMLAAGCPVVSTQMQEAVLLAKSFNNVLKVASNYENFHQDIFFFLTKIGLDESLRDACKLSVMNNEWSERIVPIKEKLIELGATFDICYDLISDRYPVLAIEGQSDFLISRNLTVDYEDGELNVYFSDIKNVPSDFSLIAKLFVPNGIYAFEIAWDFELDDLSKLSFEIYIADKKISNGYDNKLDLCNYSTGVREVSNTMLTIDFRIQGCDHEIRQLRLLRIYKLIVKKINTIDLGLRNKDQVC